MRRMLIPAASALLTLAAAGCATPAVNREKAQMSTAELAESGMECRKEKPMGSIRPQTICASPEAWAAFDDKTIDDSGRLLDQANSQPNGGFSGN